MKSILGHCLFLSGVRRLLLRNTAVIVAFHRVQDRPDPSGLSVSVATFERYCSFFARYFEVVPLRELAGRIRQGGSVHGQLAITFDDGYRDNYDLAVPVLERASLPATFFVVTRWIGSGVVPWWDRDLGVRHPWMTWDQVRSLRRRGFDVGAHTRNHVDLGRVCGAAARLEIAGARGDLEEQLGSPADLFAFPYGGRNNLADSNLELIRAAGFNCCCSSYGGVNQPKSDPFRLKRIAISPYYATPQQFGFEAAIGRTLLAS